ncbi:hypothetical protein [Yoonia sediminilitoris]|uniref:Sulfotransferase family protein n=1 Tax=Yoonia sediminilitoris TaxID=1286148 RepID=A0A2T6K9L5_9RHOB|nr:hypothetical protein [Yoonia sediminilitoris]PUB11501.1 hypothetical protein C8N45_11317 [Yoonia sediminilitoris]RCW91701.1 hypothetical protein DFP92_11317 [Yoonia sediminilitoris]
MPTDADFSVAFHIGAHKTATSHLQRSLEHSSDALADVGVRYYGPKHFRLPGRTIPALFGKKPPAKENLRKRTPREQVDRMRKGGHRLVLSEENFIGVLNTPRRRMVERRYPHAAQRISDLAESMDVGGFDILLGVRQSTSFLNSAYCQMLMGGKVTPVDDFKRLNPLSGVDWQALVAELRQATGVKRLLVWQYEDYGMVFDQISAGLVGHDHAELVQPHRKRIHVSLSGQAVSKLQDLAGTGHQQIEQSAADLSRQHPVSEAFPPFDCFSEDTHRAAAETYASQIDAIGAMDGVTLLRPRA